MSYLDNPLYVVRKYHETKFPLNLPLPLQQGVTCIHCPLHCAEGMFHQGFAFLHLLAALQSHLPPVVIQNLLMIPPHYAPVLSPGALSVESAACTCAGEIRMVWFPVQLDQSGRFLQGIACGALVDIRLPIIDKPGFVKPWGGDTGFFLGFSNFHYTVMLPLRS